METLNFQKLHGTLNSDLQSLQSATPRLRRPAYRNEDDEDDGRPVRPSRPNDKTSAYEERKLPLKYMDNARRLLT
jgi:hypothetical protein